MTRAFAVSALRTVPALVPMAFLVVCFLVPLLFLFWISIHQSSSTDFYGPNLTAAHYAGIIGDSFYRTVILRTLSAGIIVVGSCLLIGYPMALALNAIPRRWRTLALAVLLFPLMLSNVIRAYGWIAVLGRRGVANTALMAAGVTDHPLTMLYSFEAVTVALMTILLPYLVISITNSLDSIDKRYIEAAQSLGAGPVRTFAKVIWPLSAPGVASGLMIIFLLMLSAYVTINLIGGPRFKLVVSLVYDTSMNFEWPKAAALAFILLALGLAGAAAIFLLLRPYRAQGKP
jgi:putative spermidine/putrescine transport system permease protein